MAGARVGSRGVEGTGMAGGRVAGARMEGAGVARIRAGVAGAGMARLAGMAGARMARAAINAAASATASKQAQKPF